MSDDRWNAFITRVEPATPMSGPLSGRTLAVKDLFDTAGIRTTYGSKIYADHVPTRNAVAVQRLVDAGAVIVGKTHLPEFAWSVIGQNEWYGTCHNPAHPGKTTGGSSSGSAAALAAGLCELALGSDTGCSIRLPSACCGTVGLKSQWGLIPLDGAFPLCPTLDTAGPMARTVGDTALMWSVLADRPVPEPRLAGLTVGLLRKAPCGRRRATSRSRPTSPSSGSPTSSGSARASSRPRFPSPKRTRGRCSSTRRCESHRETFPSRADDYGYTIRPKLERAQDVQPDDVEAAYAAVHAWRRYEPPVDLYVAPASRATCRRRTSTRRDVRFPLSAYVRWVNMLGWAGLAIGNLQLIAPHDETVLAAGLAWERG